MSAAGKQCEWTVTDWVSRFEAVGGCLMPDSVGWMIAGRTLEEQEAARRIYGEIEYHPERFDAVRAYSQTPEQLRRYYAALNRGDE